MSGTGQPPAPSGTGFHLGMLSPISIAELRPLLRPGAWRSDLPLGMGGTPANLLCRELAARGQRLTVFTLDPTARDEVVLDGEGVRICIGPHGGPPGRRPARDFFARERAWLLSAIRREKPDVLHAQWTYVYALAAQESGLPHLITAHDAALHVLRHSFIPYRIASTLIARRVLSRARHVVSVSPYVAEHICRWMGYRGEPTVIPNGMPQELFDRGDRRKRSGASPSFATLLNGWNRLKNARAALEAFASVRLQRPDVSLHMIGPGHEPGGEAEAWARAAGMSAGVRFLGPMANADAMRCLAEEVDVLIHPSLEEANPMVVLEASALGLPVVAGARSGGVPWTLDGGAAGILVDVRSPSAIASAMLELADSSALQVEWGRRAKENALRRFHIRVVADAYLAAYAHLLGAPA